MKFKKVFFLLLLLLSLVLLFSPFTVSAQPDDSLQECAAAGLNWFYPWEGDLGAGTEPYCCGDDVSEHYNQKRFLDDPANGQMGQGIYACCNQYTDCVGEGSPAPGDSLCYEQGFILGPTGNHPNTEYICQQNVWYGCNNYYLCNVRLGTTCVFDSGIFKWKATSSLTEDCTDGYDNDCDGKTDAADPDCQPRCINECTLGERVCYDYNTIQYCGYIDQDECTEWGYQSCPADQVCINGYCEAQPQCTPGETRECGYSDVGECQYGIQTCNINGEWGTCIGAIYPVAEICDGKDNDCDGQIDEGGVCGSNFTCVDNDGDGYNVTVYSTQSSAYSTKYEKTQYSKSIFLSFVPRPIPIEPPEQNAPVCGNDICEYGENECIPGFCIPETNLCMIKFCGYLCPEDCQVQTPQPDVTNCGPVDCDDTNPNIHPGAVEICNGIDDDCDGLIDEGCINNTAPVVTVDLVPNHPSNDDDLICQGTAYDAEGGFVTVHYDITVETPGSDAIGVILGDIACTYSCQVIIPNSITHPGQIYTCYMTPFDGLSYGETDSDFVVIGSGNCTPQPEICNYQDDDCDGLIDEDLQNCQCSEYPAVVLEGECTTNAECPANYRCAKDNLNLINNHCVYGLVNIDERVPICGGYINAHCREGFTCYPVPHADAGVCFDITYSPAPSEEICDGIDNDCDGLIDEGNVCGNVTCTDNDGDGYAVEGGNCGPVDCDDTNANVHPGATEVCNGIDDDCDGLIDEGGVCNQGYCGDSIIQPGEQCDDGNWGPIRRNIKLQ